MRRRRHGQIALRPLWLVRWKRPGIGRCCERVALRPLLEWDQRAYGVFVRQRLTVERELVEGHTLLLEATSAGTRAKASDPLTVVCSCGELLAHGNVGAYRRALNLAEQNHRIAVGWPDLVEWHGTPNGYANYGCRCDPCRWAWASYRRGDDPVFAGPVWLDDMLASMGTL